MSIETNFTFFRGEDITLNFAMLPPTDITGWNLTFTVKNKLAGTTQFTKDNGGTGGLTVVNAKAGTFKVTIAKADTQATGTRQDPTIRQKPFIGNRNPKSRTYHTRNCSSLLKINDENRIGVNRGKTM